MKFNDDEMFCKKCFLRDGFFTGGGSWSPNACPICGGTETILYKNMNNKQRRIASKLQKEWWIKKYGN